MTGRAAILALLISSTAAAQPTRQPVTLEEFVVLVQSRVSPDDLVAKLRQDGAAFPPTPAIRRHLRKTGLDDATLSRVFPVTAGAARTEVPGMGLAFVLPEGWSLSGKDGMWKVAIPDVPPAVSCELILRTWDLGSDPRLDRDPKRKVLSDLVPAQTRTLVERGFEITETKPLPGLGITGVAARLARSRVGEAPASVDVALFSRKDRVMLVRAHIVGATDDPWLTQARAHVAGMLASVSPSPGAPPLRIDGTRILVRTASEQFVVDRGGVRSEIPHVPRARPLSGDPLCLQPPWEKPKRTDTAATDFSSDRLGPTRRVEVVSDPGSDHVLCAVATDHHPVPGRTGEPVSAGRLVYVPPKVGPELTLLIRNRPATGQPVIGQPRFLPSGHEILFQDPVRGLCVVPRDGGLPVVLVPGPVSAAEPWISVK